jgi:hypothetical protein
MTTKKKKPAKASVKKKVKDRKKGAAGARKAGRAGRSAKPARPSKSGKKPPAKPKPVAPRGAHAKTSPPPGTPSGKAKVPAAAGQAEGGKGGAPHKAPRRSGKSSRRPTLLRRGPDGEILAPGDLLLPGGVQRAEEIIYLFRGCAAAEHSVGDDPFTEVFSKRPVPEAPGEREELTRTLGWARERFERTGIEPVVPARGVPKRTFSGVVERARQRRREIGAFLRGLDIGRTETSHMDAHGEASLQSLMEWAARLENLAEADEPAQADYNQFHRGLDQLESTTEALIIDVEQTLRRLQDRLRA